MKNYKKTIGVALIALTLTGVITLGGCEKSEVSENMSEQTTNTGVIYLLQDPKNADVKKEVEWLHSKGRMSDKEYSEIIANGIYFGSNSIENQIYIIGGDVGYSREQIQQEMKTDKSARHRKRSTIYAGGNIKVRVFSTVPASWKTAIKDACLAWNGLGYGVSFTTYDASTNIEYAGEIDLVYNTSVPGYTMPSNTYALTYPIASSGLGEKVTINSAYSGTAPTATTMKSIMAHELGHAIGLMHVDTSDGVDVASTISCGGTTNYTNPTSIMRALFTYNAGWVGFNLCDKTAIDYYW